MRHRFSAALAALSLNAMMMVAPTQAASKDMALERQIDALLAQMSLTEKLGQTQLRDWGMYSAEQMDAVKQAVREGRIGGFLNVSMSRVDNQAFAMLQKIAIEESPHKIPLLFGQDVIHGYKTIFPIPLGQAASWNPALIEQGARIAAEEASADGVRWTFAPMIDISRDPRWGRIAESLGEDPYLVSQLGSAMVRGFQTDDPSKPNTLAATGKHFAGYGAAEAGRDYNTAYIPEGLLRDVYLPPFKAAADAGMLSVMTAYHSLNDIPATANAMLLKQILRKEWQFDGLIVSDWNSVPEMINHGYASDLKHAAELSVNAGLDFEMQSDGIAQYGEALLAEQRISEAQLDEMVRNILRIKLKLGLWQSPYPRGGQAKTWLQPSHLAAAEKAAIESFVLLKNEHLLPLNKQQKIAVVGPLADAAFDQLGTWIYDGRKTDTRTFWPALQQYLSKTTAPTFAAGLQYSRDQNTEGFAEALRAAAAADVIVFVGGEESVLTGEGHSRGDIRLPGKQQELLSALKATGKPLVVVLMAGRPLQLDQVLTQADALLMAWHPGTMGGPALVKVLFGEQAPSGRLPLTWPVAVGQIPIYYNHLNTGRPPTDSNYTRIDKIAREVFQHDPGNSSNHLDLGHLPQFPFGFGLSYSTIDYGTVTLSKTELTADDSLQASVTIKNTGKRAVVETVQLYIQDITASRVRPVRELKNFQRIALKPGQSQQVKFTLRTADLAFHDATMKWTSEPGQFRLWLAPHAQAGAPVLFTLR